MSDQEPLGKRMLDQLRNHTEPYQPEAWEDFEQFRTAKNRNRRTVLYWLSAAAVPVLLGSALLTSDMLARFIPATPIVTHKEKKGGQTNGGQTNAWHPRKPHAGISDNAVPLPFPQLSAESQESPGTPKEYSENASLGSRKEYSKKASHGSRKGHSKKGAALADTGSAEITDFALTNDQLPKANREQSAENINPGLLASRPFSFTIARFGKSYISLPESQTRETQPPHRSIRWGVTISQQSNRAAHTDMELNYGLGGALLVPFSDKIALVTGISGSKQSLNVQEPARLNAAAGSAQLQGVRYRWVNLEIPLQVQYKLKTFKKIGFTASGGLALQTSVGQAADYHYKTQRTIATFAETAGGPVLVSTQTVEELSSVTEDDKKRDWVVGSPLYLGLGISYQWQNTAVEVEPYVKYPLGASTAERLRLTTVGIQLRLTKK
ncbi:hypothetical protein [Dyadobacter fermentans]|uniref:Outer membrane protein beta-barrel domain-containing protein n=1 Tax=Dyadobacter fermentans (strain ATCC 700827 / DSM 18053 / CIP 107007 / KCTC 52180 / NS114) TaxID=471854 RepID=C6W1F0_DYAFD|nr:hypothetical protein [Dyadobacter fermentans]ACT92007.1 hypothetical protein Dfer_0746 [Dyadobacter fermentans DSM 18053]